MNPPRIIKPRDREAIIRSLRSGVVPAVGLHHIQVGRAGEIASFLRDIDTVADGGASFRIIIGEYGSGKSFFLALTRLLALEKGLIAMTADMSPQMRFVGSAGQPRLLLRELAASTATRTKPEGAALGAVVERLASRPEGAAEALMPLRQLPGGATFADVALKAAEGSQEALRWLSCEYTSKTDARRDLGVSALPSGAEDDFYGALRLYAALARAAGYKGLMVCIDELVNLFKISNAVSRRANYETILNMINRTLQGSVHGLGIVLSGTPEFLTDPRRGLYSYEALRSRLAENSFAARAGLRDLDSTVLRLPSLTPPEVEMLLRNVANVFFSGSSPLTDSDISAFLNHCSTRIGDAYFRTPRNTLKAFIDLLSLLRQYPDRRPSDLLEGVVPEPDREPSSTSSPLPDNDLTDFRL